MQGAAAGITATVVTTATAGTMATGRGHSSRAWSGGAILGTVLSHAYAPAYAPAPQVHYAPPPEQVWVPGHYEGRYERQWVPGHWEVER